MDAAQKFFQSLLLNSTAKTYRLENDQKTDFDEDNEIENAEEPSNSSNKSQSSSSDLKGRLKISLNNARYGLTTKGKSNFSDKSPICMLGNLYRGNYSKAINENNNSFNNFKIKLGPNKSSAKDDDSFNNFNDEPNGLMSYEKFQEDFKSIIWFTYRKGFKTLPGTKLESDCGWGCMLRCGQMLVARALINHLSQNILDAFNKISKETLRRRVIKEFLDCPEAPLSLHKLVEIGFKQNKHAGDWYGPASTAFIFKDALDSTDFGPTFRSFSFQNLSVYVSIDGVVCTDDIERLCVNNSGSRASSTEDLGENRKFSANFGGFSTKYVFDDGRRWQKSLLLLIPLRLGAESTNILYVQHLKCIFSLKYFVGMIGGKPKRSVYFVGWHDDNLIYLDPHYCQDVVDHNSATFSLQSFSCPDPRKMPFSAMDPSCAVGFYLRDRNDLIHFLADVSEIVEFGGQSTKYPLFSVVHTREELPRKISVDSFQDADRSRSNSSSNILKPRLNSIGSTKGYVLL